MRALASLLLAAACAPGMAGDLPEPLDPPTPGAVEAAWARAERAGFFEAAAGPVTPPPPPPQGQQAILVAQGMMGRTLLSCDDGQSWIHDRSFDREGSEMVCGDTTPVRCEQTSCKLKQADGSCSVASPCDCGHHPGYAKGVAIANGQILANFGWGHPGVVLRSVNGASWSTLRHFDASYLFPNLVFGAGRFVHFSSQPYVSDDGLAWRQGGFAGFNGPGQPWTSPRAFGFLDHGGGRFIGAIDGNNIRLSADRGDTWTTPAMIPAGCTDGIGNSQQILTGNGVALMVTSSGNACRTTDGGDTWTLHSIGGTGLSPWGVFANGHFTVWGGSTRYTSPDGASWTATGLSRPVSLGAVGAGVSGTLVAVNTLWEGYEQQRFLRSTDDGLTWTTLADDKYTRGHPIHRFAAGVIDRASGVCP
jgi:hypothetical protein